MSSSAGCIMYSLRIPGLMVSFMRWKRPFLFCACLRVTPPTRSSRSCMN